MGYVDIHSHILPHLDDGAVDMDQSIEMLRIAEREGITHMIATPHYKSGRFRADSAEVLMTLQELQEEASEAGIHIKLYPGTEIFYHSDLEQRLEQGHLHTLNDTEYLLVEFSPFEAYGYIRNAADDILSMGYHPVLAHVERYECLLGHADKIQELKDMGCGIQVNAGSVAGDYGFAAKRFTGALLKKQLIDYLGTDAHNTGKRSPFMGKCAKIICRKCGEHYAEQILEGNALRDFLS